MFLVYICLYIYILYTYKHEQEEAGEREAASSAARETLESKLQLMQQEVYASNDTHDALSRYD
jgi:Ca2+/Na+ antiporter